MISRVFKDRTDAGQQLARVMGHFREKDPVILAMPRGGWPVCYEIAKALEAPLDILLVRKIGLPDVSELAIGAVVDGDDPQLVLNEDVLRLYDVPKSYIEQCEVQQLDEIERRRKLYRADHPLVNVRNKTAIVIDDGLATGATARAALKVLPKRKPKRIVLAVPVMPLDRFEEFTREADDVICLETPKDLWAISLYYRSFPQVSDDEVNDILKRAESFHQKEDANDRVR